MAERRIPVLPPLPEEELRSPDAAVEAPPAETLDVGASTEPPALGPAQEQRPRPRRGRRERGPEGRRLWSAGHAIVVLALALGLSVLLNAPGVHKKAYNQEAGWQRDVALALTGPLASVSHALLLDRARKGVQAAIGRSGEDDIDTSVAGAGAPEPTAPTTPSPETRNPRPSTKLAFSPQHKLKIWVAGDSLVIVPGYAILRAAGGSPVMKGLGVDGRVATGLERPDVFNWFDEIRRQMRVLEPNVVVLGFGGNDDKRYMTGLPPGVSIGEFGDASWRREYARRVEAVFSTIVRAGGHVVWIGLPQTRSAEQTQRFDLVNAVVAREARKHPRTVTYVDTYAMFAGPDGGYTEYLTGPSGGTIKVRAGDGVHFENAGGDMIARQVMAALGRTFDLTSWKEKRRGASG
jgi:hypothetical protein